jgi:hypothetical protein
VCRRRLLPPNLPPPQALGGYSPKKTKSNPKNHEKIPFFTLNERISAEMADFFGYCKPFLNCCFPKKVGGFAPNSPGVTYILKTYANLAWKTNPGLIPEIVSCHSLRHSKAMHLLQAGVNIVYVRDLLGHVSIQTTDIYARADSKLKREALEKAYVDLVPENAKTREWEKNKNLLDWLKSL